jgi:hypothetical protein
MNHLATAMLALAIMVAAVPAARADTTCPPIPPSGGTVNGNLTVTGACTLDNVKVGGNVRVDGAGASLSLSGGKVDGNITADDCLKVFLENGAAVGGNVHIQSCTEQSGYAGESGVVLINGNFRCVDDPSGCVAKAGEVGGNVSLTGDGGAFILDNVSIGGNLKADDNTAPPILVINNSVGGNVEARGNTGTPIVVQNRINGNLTCQSGSVVEANLVHGKIKCP